MQSDQVSLNKQQKSRGEGLSLLACESPAAKTTEPLPRHGHQTDRSHRKPPCRNA